MKINIKNQQVNVKVNPPRISVKSDAQRVYGGTEDYELLTNKPKINEITLVGNKTLEELDIQVKGNYADTRVTNIEIDDLFN